MLAKVSGNDVPKATKVIAVTDYSIPSAHPSTVAISPTIPVTRPIYIREMTKDGQPPIIETGGTVANNTFQKIVIK